MLKKYEMPQVGKYLLAALFPFILYSLYLAGYGPFDLSLLGALASLPAAILLYRLDTKVKFLTYDLRGKRLAALAIISFGLYFTFSGYIITRGVHELIAKPNEQAAHIGPGSSRQFVCKYSIRIHAPVRRDYCPSKDVYERFKIDSITWRTRAWLITSESPLGSTIAFIGTR